MSRPPDDMPAARVRAVRSLAVLAGRLARSWGPQVAALAAAAAVVATTIAGALCVGDATARGLRRLAAERLGRIDAAVVGGDFFTAASVADLTARAAADPAGPGTLVPAIVMEVTVEAAAGEGRAVPATLLACDDPSALGFAPAPPPLSPDAVLLNEPARRSLAARPGDAVILRLPTRSSVPADSPLGRREPESTGRRLAVGAVLPEVGLGQFALRPAQVTRPLVVTSLATARAILDRDDAVNAVFAIDAPAATDWLRARLRPGLADVGLTLAPAAGASGPRLTSRRLILAPEVDRVAAEVLGPMGGRPSLVFLANDLRPLDAAGRPGAARVPYSTVLGIDTVDHPAGRLVDDAGNALPLPGPDDILIDRWLADDLAAQGTPVAVGDRLAVTSFLPETLHGRVEEAAATFRIAGIAAMRGAAVARDLVPEVEGVSDEASIADWDPPFPFDAARVRTTPPHDEDDRYWKAHGTTPKAFVALDTARRIAGSRFGRTTAWHLPPGAAADVERARDRLAAGLRPEELGLRVVPLRDAALAAARGSTPFGGLFLALSSFVVAAGLLLEWLLFDLLVAARSRDVGILAAVGWPPRRLAALLLAIAAIAAAAGAAIGTLAGPLWARGLLAALGRAWEADVAAGSARVFAVPASWSAAVPGGLAAALVSLAAVAWSARRAARAAPWRLLKGGAETAAPRRVRPGWAAAIAALALGAALAMAFAGGRAEPARAVAAFFGAGFLALAGLLAAMRLLLVGRPARPLASLAGLARRGLARTAGRGFAVAAIVAVAQFLVVAVSSFAVRPPADPADRHGPTGGYALLAAFDPPTSVDPLDAEIRAALGLSAAEERAVAGCAVERLRSSAADDASCTNLYAAGRPTVLGAGPGFIERGGFAFAGHVPLPAGATNPWTLLERSGPGPVPAVVDQATAQWALKLGGVGATFTVEDDAGRPVDCMIVGLLSPGILQGVVIVAEREFERIFPDRSGYGLALVDDSAVAAADRPSARAGLERAWAESGAAVTPTVDRLRSLMAVQNTFLAGFQTLGTLGLLLGTAGVAAVLLQGVLERLGSLALLRAVGFTPGRIRRLLVLETLLPVGLGLLAGTLAGCLAVAPALVAATARVPLGWIAATSGLTLATAIVAAVAAAARAPIPERPGAAGG